MHWPHHQSPGLCHYGPLSSCESRVRSWTIYIIYKLYAWYWGMVINPWIGFHNVSYAAYAHYRDSHSRDERPYPTCHVLYHVLTMAHMMNHTAWYGSATRPELVSIAAATIPAPTPPPTDTCSIHISTNCETVFTFTPAVGVHLVGHQVRFKRGRLSWVARASAESLNTHTTSTSGRAVHLDEESAAWFAFVSVHEPCEPCMVRNLIPCNTSRNYFWNIIPS